MEQNIIDKELNNETRERLAAYLPISPRAEFQYVPKVYRESEKSENPIPRNQWPVFTLRGLSGAEETECLGGKFTYGAYLCGVVRRGVVGWKNWGDCQYKPEYRFDGKLSDEALARFPHLLIVELGGVINDCSKLSDEEITGLGL